MRTTSDPRSLMAVITVLSIVLAARTESDAVGLAATTRGANQSLSRSTRSSSGSGTPQPEDSQSSSTPNAEIRLTEKPLESQAPTGTTTTSTTAEEIDSTTLSWPAITSLPDLSTTGEQDRLSTPGSQEWQQSNLGVVVPEGAEPPRHERLVNLRRATTMKNPGAQDATDSSITGLVRTTSPPDPLVFGLRELNDASSASANETSYSISRSSGGPEGTTTTASAGSSATRTRTALTTSGYRVKNELVPGVQAKGVRPGYKVNVADPLYHTGGVGAGKALRPNVPSALGKYSPYFEDGEQEVNITARIGDTVYLDCSIGMLGNKTVTWSYHSQDVFRLLTVARNAYSLDERIGLAFKYPTNWRLRIQFASPRDSGLYECQVATYPPLVKKIYLLVTAPILSIMDDMGKIESGERHLKAGSALRLRCEARDLPEEHNENVVWTRGDELLTDDVSENRTSVYEEGRELEVLLSTLLIERAGPRHAGNYSCVVPEKARATVAVHVLNGELPAAVHDVNGASRSVLNLWLIHLAISYVFSR